MGYTAGQKVRASELEATDNRIIARHRRTTSSGAITASTQNSAIGILRLAASVKAGRAYHVGCPQAAAYCEVSVSRSQWFITYTTNGTNPTQTSTLLAQSGAKHPDLGSVDFFPFWGLYLPSTDHTFTATLWVWRPVGSGNIFVYGGTPPLDFLIKDMGDDPGSTGTTL